MDTISDAQVNDDKTVIVLVNPDVEVRSQAPEYYAEPDWTKLKCEYDELWKRKAYPHLHGNDTSMGDIASDEEKNVSKPAAAIGSTAVASADERTQEDVEAIQFTKKKGLLSRLMGGRLERSGRQGENQ